MKISVKLSFPLGALFYTDIVDFTCQSFWRMVKKLNCVNIDQKCVDCPLKDACQYYRLTGENFTYYPAIIFKKSLFEQSLFRDNESYTFDIYFIGHSSTYSSYVDVFFQDYNDFLLGNHPYQIRSFIKENVMNEMIDAGTIVIKTIVEGDDFKNVYNKMVDYYNHHYDCDYHFIKDVEVISIRQMRLDIVKMPTRRIKPVGYTYSVIMNDVIDSNFLLTGIGQYNYLGGGRVEIRDQTSL